MTPGTRLRERLRVDLLAARLRRDEPAVAAIGSLLTSLGNAEAVPLEPGPYAVVQGSAELPRQELDQEQVRTVVRGEIDERRKAVAEYERLGADVSRLQAELETLQCYAADE